jgi:hypothetical protein
MSHLGEALGGAMAYLIFLKKSDGILAQKVATMAY